MPSDTSPVRGGFEAAQPEMPERAQALDIPEALPAPEAPPAPEAGGRF